jgi:hypothetical protein
MLFACRFRRVCAALLIFFTGCPAFAADFGAKVSYQQNAPIQFDKFTLTYLAQRHVASKEYPQGMVFYDFRVKSAQGEQTVSWSAGDRRYRSGSVSRWRRTIRARTEVVGQARALKGR